MNAFDFSRKVSITLINMKGEYIVFNRKFADLRHFNNWMNMMERYNYKSIGIEQ